MIAPCNAPAPDQGKTVLSGAMVRSMLDIMDTATESALWYRSEAREAQFARDLDRAKGITLADML